MSCLEFSVVYIYIFGGLEKASNLQNQFKTLPLMLHRRGMCSIPHGGSGMVNASRMMCKKRESVIGWLGKLNPRWETLDE